MNHPSAPLPGCTLQRLGERRKAGLDVVLLTELALFGKQFPDTETTEIHTRLQPAGRVRWVSNAGMGRKRQGRHTPMKSRVRR